SSATPLFASPPPVLLIQPLQNCASATSGDFGYFFWKSASSASASLVFFRSASVRAACSVAAGASARSGNAEIRSLEPRGPGRGGGRGRGGGVLGRGTPRGGAVRRGGGGGSRRIGAKHVVIGRTRVGEALETEERLRLPEPRLLRPPRRRRHSLRALERLERR